MQPQTFADDFAHRHAWIQRRVRVLEDHLHALRVALKVVRRVLLRQQFAAIREPCRAVLSCRPINALPNVDLPEPLSPTRPTISFSAIDKRHFVERVHDLIAADRESVWSVYRR